MTESFPMARMTVDEWHQWRRDGIGGSDIAALVGLSPYASPTSLFYEKRGLLPDDHVDSERQRIGRRMEQVLAHEFQDRTGLYCIAAQTTREHATHSFARCTVDGFATETDNLDDTAVMGVIEFKTDGRFGWPEGVPPSIRAQCVWEMGITCSPNCWLVVMFAGFRVEVFEIPFDHDAQSDWRFMLDTAQRFWIDHVLTGDPPPADDHTATTRALETIYDPEPGSLIIADQDARLLVSVLRDAQSATKAAKAVEDSLRNELRAVLGDATELIDGLTDDGDPILLASWRPQIAHRVDLDALRQASPDLVEAFTIEAPSRVLRLHKPKGK